MNLIFFHFQKIPSIIITFLEPFFLNVRGHSIIFKKIKNVTLKLTYGDFPSGAVVKNPPSSAGDTGSSPGLGRSHRPWSN